MRRVLVLGASGFIGRHVCRVIGATRGLTRVPMPRDVDLAETGMDDLERMFTDGAPDVVVNCVGRTHGKPAALVRGNVVAVARMLEAIRVLAAPPRLVHLASSAEYGGRSDGTPIRESDVPQPAGPYGVTKLAGTELVLASGLDAVVLRIFNISGPESPIGTLLGRVTADLRDDADVVRLGSLDAWRDYVDVRDVARAIVLAAIRPAPRILNVGRGEAVHARELVHRLVEVSGTGAAVTEEKGGEGNHAGSDASTVRWQRADTTAIREALDWSPTIDVDQSVHDTWHG